MLVKTKGIVLNTIKYSDSSIICRIFTEEYGLLSFIIHGVRKRKARHSASFFQPFTILEIDLNYKAQSGLQNIREVSIAQHTSGLHSDIRKSTIALFLSEILYKSLREEEQDKSLFEFLRLSIDFLDSVETSFTNFHLIFLVQLSKYLGFYPSTNVKEEFFNMQSGNFDNRISHEQFLDTEESRTLKKLMNTSFLERENLKIESSHRRKMLSKLIEYYQIHIPGMGKISSREVLESVFQ